MQERQFDCIADLLDLPGQAADVGVGDVRDLLQHEILDLGLRHPLVRVTGLGVDQQRVARLEPDIQQRLGEMHDPLLVGMTDDQRPVAAEQLAQRRHLADTLERATLDDRQCLVEPDLLARAQFGDGRRTVRP